MKKIVVFMFVLFGGWLGIEISQQRRVWQSDLANWWKDAIINGHFWFMFAGVLIAIAIWLIVAPMIIGRWRHIFMANKPATLFDTITIIFGGMAGITLAQWISGAYFTKTWLPWQLSVVVHITFMMIGVFLSYRHRAELRQLLKFSNSSRTAMVMSDQSDQQMKILDTSVIIDGRIADLCKTGFVEGSIIVPVFVLEELQHIADSADLLKRNRGRRGLDILNKMQKELLNPVIIDESRFEDTPEVDSKLVKLAKQTHGKVVTNDFNLNKVCELQGVRVLNINDLANAIKPVVLPGEEMMVTILKDGKEFGQGVAYLDDGTMIVVESGREYIGSSLYVVVTSVLQTSAGRMIFARPKLLEKAL
jgi:uncharacterized protein YacL